ncbi:phosphoribosyltransferase-like protein [Lysobacter silvisoli]|uniref:PRTase-CE domain-containing protein n=1 Tax=Lysobacter silvisoli TaxID=2293254 RepID=A0A371JWP8_9GAMM|nr:hypothetical protein [Lysobacter silvisoli]RDZ26017.1 hypothetical protein DX914_19340 [Lysobacter silvisoli]
MRDENAIQLLAKVMSWTEDSALQVRSLQLLADFKYDSYQRFGPGRKFIESLALWLNQFDPSDREAALELVRDKLVFLSDDELSHLVTTAYPDLVIQERLRIVAEENAIPLHRVREIASHPRFNELRIKSLFLGLSDGARTNELRRASFGEISNEQIWQAYELGDNKVDDMLEELKDALEQAGSNSEQSRFNLIWLLDDFSGSGNTYIRYDTKNRRFKGKLQKIYSRLHRGDLVDRSNYEVYLLLYVATRQAIDHIEYWAERFTSEKGYKPLQLRVLCPIENEVRLVDSMSAPLLKLIHAQKNYDERAHDKHTLVGGTEDARLGFAGCALPVVLAHNTPNNSIYLLWGPELLKPFGLFPRVSRHREF